MKTTIVTSLLFLVALLSAHADNNTPIQQDPIIPDNTWTPTPEERAYQKRVDALNQEFQSARCEPFVINKESDGMMIHVKKNEIFNIAFTLPNDTQDGLETHMIFPPSHRKFEEPIQGWEDISALSDADGNSLNFGSFYGLTSGELHSSKLQQGVVDHSSFIANAVGTFPLTFTIIAAKWTTDVYPCQYRTDSTTRKSITINVQVD